MIVPSPSIKASGLPCPSSETLEQFVRLSLSSDDNQAVALHIGECLKCQSRLDESTASHLSPNSVRPPSPSDDETIRRIVRGLCRGLGITDQRPFEAPPISFEKPSDGKSLGMLKRYLICRELGIGATATVFEAVDTNNGERVAIKLIRAVDEATLRRVRREAEVLAGSDHPYLLPIRSVEVADDGRYFLVMPLVDGKPLSRMIHDPEGLTFDRIAEILAKIAEALEVVHQIGLLHRDVKPSNILVDQNGNPKLTDFGAVAIQNEESSLTETGATIGTPCYMSPEQALAQDQLDARSDVYSLGATLYECLTKARPFRGSTVDVLRQILRCDPVPPRQFDARIPMDLEVICLKALAKEKDRRYQSAKEMELDLTRWRLHRPIFAKPLTGFQQAQIWIRRNRITSFLVLCLFLSVVSGMIGMYSSWRYAVYQRDLALEGLQDSRRAIDQFYAKIGASTSKLDQPGLQSIRKELLNEAIVFYKELLNKWPDDPLLEGEMAMALMSLAEITESLGKVEESLAAWQDAENAVEALVRKQPDREDFQIKLYQCRFHRANGLTSSNRLDEAVIAFREVGSALQVFQKAYPRDLRFRRDLASCAGSLGNCLLRKHLPDEAAEYYRQACSAFEHLLNEEPNNVDLQMKLAMTLTNLALCLPAEEQIEILSQSKTMFSQVFEHRKLASDARRWAKVDLHLGMALVEVGRKPEAIAGWTHATVLLKPHVDTNPELMDVRDILGQLYYQLGLHLESKDDSLHALGDAKREQAILCESNPDSEPFREQLKITEEAIDARR